MQTGLGSAAYSTGSYGTGMTLKTSRWKSFTGFTSAPRDPERLKSWLYRVASNMGLNALRARQRRRRYEQDAGTQVLQHAPALNPADLAERSEAREHVREVLAQMRPRTAQMLVLRHSGLSYAEIAAVMNVSVGSVGTLLARAEKAFERHYRALEESDETL